MNEPNNIHRELMRIMTKDPDHCSICGAEFPDRSFAYGGLTKNGTIELVGVCCADQLDGVLCSSIVVR